MAREEPVYEEWESTLVKSSHGSNVHYRIFWGTVNWSGVVGDLQKSVIVFMQYGSSEKWRAALSANEVALKLPAHILTQDIQTVLPVLAEYGRR